MKTIGVFCGSREGVNSHYIKDARQLGLELAKDNIRLVYGGSSSGLMGTVSDAVMEKGGEVIGVIPKILIKQEVAHHHITDLRIVDSMHERKATMYELSDAFIALPGGIGTLEELAEVLTWSAIGQHSKPLGFLNTDGYYNPLLDLFDHMVTEGFLLEEIRNTIVVSDKPDELIRLLKSV
ncbi:TIGR00730 family Rossman fold protein [Bacillus alkalicellulosilyticus]|uniref:LOG family protein n=1 Tax=Alkalihalobacterium alkalicellulosilyticum TaxID=1912214 RepID=UPI000997C820|nr:TIGR00730 family Rossman fold protein [Bacillus alkalicellulosilyticus]